LQCFAAHGSLVQSPSTHCSPGGIGPGKRRTHFPEVGLQYWFMSQTTLKQGSGSQAALTQICRRAAEGEAGVVDAQAHVAAQPARATDLRAGIETSGVALIVELADLTGRAGELGAGVRDAEVAVG